MRLPGLSVFKTFTIPGSFYSMVKAPIIIVLVGFARLSTFDTLDRPSSASFPRITCSSNGFGELQFISPEGQRRHTHGWGRVHDDLRERVGARARGQDDGPTPAHAYTVAQSYEHVLWLVCDGGVEEIRIRELVQVHYRRLALVRAQDRRLRSHHQILIG